MQKKVLAYSRDFQRMYFYKDLFLIPYYIAKCKDLPLEFCYGYNMGDDNIPQSYRNVKLRTSHRKKISAFYEIIDSINFILFQAKQIETLFVVGISFIHLLRIYLFKKINPSSNVVIFGDMEPGQAKEIVETDFYKSHTFFGRIKQILANFVFSNSLFLVANTDSFRILENIYLKRNWKGLLHFYPCIDDEKVKEYGIVRKSWDEKENIMICVGRIGNYQKNTEMLLDALKRVDLWDWKIYMIGPITNSFDLKECGDFQKVIDKFFVDYPQYKDKLIFTGMIYDQKLMFDYYNKAKVLLMTSRHESWGNVYSEAASFGCYIVSTEVGGAKLCSNQWQFGTKIEQENSENLALVLKDIVEDKIDFNLEKCIPLASLDYDMMTRNILLQKMEATTL